MNERIKELADNSKITVVTTKGHEWVMDGCYIVPPDKLEQFAESIIARTLDCIYDELHDPTSDLSYHSVNSIKRRINEYFRKENNDSSKR